MRRYWIPFLIAGFLGSFMHSVAGDPFFGDAISTVSRVALNIYDSNFADLSYPEGRDPGHPILIPMLHAALWKITGLGLWASHILNSLFTLMILLVMYQWFNRSGGIQYLSWYSWTLILATPLFLAQTAMMNTHLALAAFMFLAAYTWRFDKRGLFIIASCLAVLTHLQAVFYILALLLCFVFDRMQISGSRPNNKILMVATLWFIPSAIVFGLWGLWHYNIEGWAFSSVDYGAHRGFPGIKGFLVNLVLSDWRILDYGQIALVIPAVWLFVKIYRSRKNYRIWNHPSTLFIVLYLVNAIAISATTTTGPAHRYFLPVLPFLVMAAAEAMMRIKRVYAVALWLVLLSGHFWFYPGKTIGDATLQYRSAFTLLDQVEAEVDGRSIYSYAPLGNPSREMFLKEGKSPMRSLYGRSIDSVTYVLQSNVSGDFSADELEHLRTNWHGTTFQKGKIRFDLYANPDSVATQPEGWKLLGQSAAELWMKKLKKNVKGQ